MTITAHHVNVEVLTRHGVTSGGRKCSIYITFAPLSKRMNGHEISSVFAIGIGHHS